MRKSMKSKKTALIALLSLGILGVGAAGSLAYLSDSESHTNVVTAGEVKMDLEEKNWNENDARDTVPNEVVKKDPQIKNTGVNDAIVFMTVTAPIKNVTKVQADGTKNAKANQEIFYFQKEGEKGKQANAWNLADDGWTQIVMDGESAAAGKDNGDGTATYTFAWKKPLAKDAETATLFDEIQMKNVIETELTAGEAQNIIVKAYAIQATDILQADGSAAVFELTDGKYSDADLKTIFGIVNKQGTLGDGNDSTAIPEANTNNKLNLKGADLAPAEPQNP